MNFEKDITGRLRCGRFISCKKGSAIIRRSEGKDWRNWIPSLTAALRMGLGILRFR
jgi:hypothetical protein